MRSLFGGGLRSVTPNRVLSVFLTALPMLLAGTTAGAATVVEYNISAASGGAASVAPATVAGNVVASNLVRSSGIGVETSFYGSTSGLFEAINWESSASPVVDDYFELTITPQGGTTVTYQTLTFCMTRDHWDDGTAGYSSSDYYGPASVDVRYAVGGFGAGTGTLLQTVALGSPATNKNLKQTVFSVSLAAIGSTGQPVTLRFYGYNQPAGTSTSSIAGFSNGVDGALAAGSGADLVYFEGSGANLTVAGVVNSPSQPPVIAGFDDVTFQEEDVKPVGAVIDSSVGVTDPDSSNMAGGALTVSYATYGATASETLSIRDQGTAAGQIGFDGSTVSYGGATIGTVAAPDDGQAGSNLVVNLTTTGATLAAVQALIENLTYGNSAEAPEPTRTIQLALSDGDGGVAVPVDADVQVHDTGLVEFAIDALVGNPASAPAITVTNVSASDLVMGPGIQSETTYYSSADHVIAASGWTDAAALDAGDYFQFSVTPNPGSQITYQTLSYGIGSEYYDASYAGPRTFQLQASTDGFATAGSVLDTVTVSLPATADRVGQTVVTSDISALGTSGNTVTFRLYGYNRAGTSTDSMGGLTAGLPGAVVTGSTLFEGFGHNVVLEGTLAAGNLAPTLSGVDDAVFTTDQLALAPQILDSDVTVTDSDSTDFNGGYLEVTYASGGGAEDTLSIRNQGTGPGQIGFDGTTVSYGGAVIGALRAGSDGQAGAPLAVDFTSTAATPAAAEALVENLTYRDLATVPAATRVLQLVVSDGAGGPSAPQRMVVTVDDTGLVEYEVDAVANNPDTVPAVTQSGVTASVLSRGAGLKSEVYYNSSHKLYGASGWSSSATPVADDYFEFVVTPPAGTKIQYQTLIYSLTADNDGNYVGPQKFQVQYSTDGFATPGTVLDTVSVALAPAGDQDLHQNTFTTDLSAMGSLSDAVTFRFYGYDRGGTEPDALDAFGGFASGVDGEDVIPGSSTVLFTGVGHNLILKGDVEQPLSLTGLDDVTYAEDVVNAAPQVIDNDVVFSAGGSLGFDGGNVSVTYVVGGGSEDGLTIRNEGTGAGQIGFDGTTVTWGGVTIGTVSSDGSAGSPLVVDLNAAATETSVDALIQNLLYGNSSDAPAATRTIQVGVEDTSGFATSATCQVTVTAVNDPPTGITLDSNVVAQSGGAGALVGNLGAVDPDGPGAAFTLIAGTGDTDNALFTISGSQLHVANAAAMAAGAYSVRVEVDDQATGTYSQAFAVTVVDDVPPSAPADVDATANSVLEGAPAGTGVGITASSSDSPASSITYDLTDSAGGRFAIGPTSGVVTVADATLLNYETAASHTITVRARDAAGNPATSQFTVAVTNVAPNAVDDTANGDENTVVTGDVLTNDTDPNGAILSVAEVGGSAAAVGVATPGSGGGDFTVGADGHFSFDPGTDFDHLASGVTASTSVTYAASDGTDQATASLTVTVHGVNDPPTVSLNTGATVDEGGTVGILHTMLEGSDPDDDASGLMWTVTGVTNGQLELATAPNVAISGFGEAQLEADQLVFRHDGSETLSATLGLSLADGGEDGASPATTTFTLTVTPVNDPPSLTGPSAQSMLEDGTLGPLSVTVDDAESGAAAVLLIAASSDQTVVPDAGLAVGGSGSARTLTISPAADANGTVTITLTADDTTDTTTASFQLEVVAVNDPPSFVAGSDQTVPVGVFGPQTVPGWASAIHMGPVDEDATQTAIAFHVTIVDDPNGIFAVEPAVATDGTLTYTPNGRAGVAQVDVALQDDGGTADGGVDTSAPARLVITVDDDGDGVPADVENAVGDGDGNGDGIPDSRQADVASLPTATGSGDVTLVVSGGCGRLEDVHAVDPKAFGFDLPYTKPYGLVGFTLPCAEATVDVHFHSPAPAGGDWSYRAYGPETPGDPSTTGWYDLPSASSTGPQEWQLTLADGQLGDDTGVDGLITGLSGPAQVPRSIPTATLPGLLLLAASIAAAGALRARREPRRGGGGRDS